MANGTVTEQIGSVSYKVLIGHQLLKPHVGQMHQTQIEYPDSSADASETFARSSDNKQIVDVQLAISISVKSFTSENENEDEFACLS